MVAVIVLYLLVNLAYTMILGVDGILNADNIVNVSLKASSILIMNLDIC